MSCTPVSRSIRIHMAWILAATLGMASALPAFAAPSPQELVQRTLDSTGRVSFVGKRVQLLTRQHLNLRATLKIVYRDHQNYRVNIAEPDKLAGVNLWMKDNRANVFFPMESLLFKNDSPTGSDEAAATIFGSVTSSPKLLTKNYNLKLLDSDIVALTPCYVLDVEPIRGYSVPAHRFWISQDTYQILKEERRWGPSIPPYFVSFYEDYQPTSEVDTGVGLPERVNTVQLQRDQQNSFIRYRTIADAERAIGAKVMQPTYIPAGFQLDSVQFATFFGTRIALLHYTDGLNWMFVSVRPKPNMFITLMAGAMALNLVEKMSELSYQAPYNYAGAEKDNHLMFAYGDLYPDELQKTLDSVSLGSN